MKDGERPQELDKIEEILSIKIPTGCENQQIDQASDQKETKEEIDDQEHTYTISSRVTETEEDKSSGRYSLRVKILLCCYKGVRDRGWIYNYICNHCLSPLKV